MLSPTAPFPDRGPGAGGGDLFERIAVALERDGYGVFPAALSPLLADALFVDLQNAGREAFHAAGVGRQDDFQVNPFVRSDRICWLQGRSGAAREFLQWSEELRVSLNRRLFLGLFDYECHYASYAPGAFYKKHLDAFRGQSNRVLSTVVYLNPEWGAGDGGELVLYEPAQDNTEQGSELVRVLPQYGTLVIFLSEEFPHEVLPARRNRYSLAGWFRVNNSTAGAVDPPR